MFVVPGMNMTLKNSLPSNRKPLLDFVRNPCTKLVQSSSTVGTSSMPSFLQSL